MYPFYYPSYKVDNSLTAAHLPEVLAEITRADGVFLSHYFEYLRAQANTSLFKDMQKALELGLTYAKTVVMVHQYFTHNGPEMQKWQEDVARREATLDGFNTLYAAYL